MEEGTEVEHLEFGVGRIVSIFGDIATVNFFGEALDVEIDELTLRLEASANALPPQGAQAITDLAFRKVFEAVTLGVVPADPQRLVDLRA